MAVAGATVQPYPDPTKVLSRPYQSPLGVININISMKYREGVITHTYRERERERGETYPLLQPDAGLISVGVSSTLSPELSEHDPSALKVWYKPK